MKCPACGFTDETGMKKITNAMNHYVRPDGKVDGVYNDDEPEIKVKDVTLVRQDVYNKRQAEKQKLAEAAKTNPEKPKA